jgi:LytS/YehU family sensor histidine kinase
MVARLGDLLRSTIDTAPLPQVRLADEFALAKRYLEIEEMRYGDRLMVQIELPADLAEVPVPNMILQPLLENAVRHGVAPYARPGRVALGASRQADTVQVTIHDSGNGFDPSAPRGVGLGITEDRLLTTYGPGRHLMFRPVDDGFETRLILPLPAAT